jgi:hypothetical protein
LLAHVQARRDEALADEVGDTFLRVHIGIQPSTPASHGGRAEVEQDGLPMYASIGKRSLSVASPCDLHRLPVRFVVRIGAAVQDRPRHE